MFEIDLRRIGCGQKVDMATIGLIARSVGVEHNSDVGCSSWQGTEVCSSIDRIGRMVSDVHSFCEIAALHAIADLLVSGVSPIGCSVCIEFGPEVNTVDEMSEFTSALLSSFSNFGVEVQNLHSVRSDYTHLTISVFGSKERKDLSSINPGSIFLSRRVGSSKMAVLREAEGESSATFIEEILSKRFIGGLQSEIFATDVTGFGLAGAALNLCQRVGARAEISADTRHVVDEDVLAVPMGCFEAQGLPEDRILTSCRRAEVVAHCTEFAGPILFFVASANEEEFVAEFEKIHGWKPLLLGAFETGPSQPGVKFTWKD